MATKNLNNDDIRCGLFKEVRVNCNYIRHLYEEYKGRTFEIEEKYEELFWHEYNGIVSCRCVNSRNYEEWIMDDLEKHINDSKWVKEDDDFDSSEEESDSSDEKCGTMDCGSCDTWGEGTPKCCKDE